MSVNCKDYALVLKGICPKCKGQLDQNGYPEEGENADELVKPMTCIDCDQLYHIVYEYKDVREVED